MGNVTLEEARKIIAAAFDKGAGLNLNPLAVAVMDTRGTLIAFENQNTSSRLRPEIAQGKASGAIALGMGSRAIFERAQQQPYFIQSVNALADGKLVPVPGGVLIKDESSTIIGAVGISGDTSDNDETCAVAGIEAAGYTADTGG